MSMHGGGGAAAAAWEFDRCDGPRHPRTPDQKGDPAADAHLRRGSTERLLVIFLDCRGARRRGQSSVTPLLFRAIIDIAIKEKSTGLAIGLATVGAGLALFDAVLSLFERRTSAVIGEGLIFDLRTKVFTHIQEMPVAFFSRTQTGALISRLNNDVIGAQQAFTDLFSNVVGNVILVTIVIGTMLVLKQYVALFCCCSSFDYVLLDGQRDRGRSEACLSAGMDDYLAEPVQLPRWERSSSVSRAGCGLPDKSVLDLSRLEEAFEDDRAGIAELLEMALETGARHRRLLEEGLANHDAAVVARAAHGIKGSAGNIGANAVYQLAIELDDRARAGNLEGARDRIDAIDAAYARLADQVREYRAGL